MSALNFTPSSTAEESESLGFAGVADDGHSVHAEQVNAAGVTEFDALEAGPVPIALVADTVNVYAVPFVSPPTVALVAGGLPVTVVGVPAVVPA
jgi:hypothetical protein